ncbi:PREDICTED: uncharacterized protein LOC109471791 [Branchiostoma belcheri]|uniref:Uncharacterized protein LOC109471791 n=1 Tax=Branchiostoma belcheri TaxID=7741 RepID=A0A6P4YC43_BRABE|nr:PREDICTED: uncharacterized protein LOC109471791 [Branchiostoma belcheri]
MNSPVEDFNAFKNEMLISFRRQMGHHILTECRRRWEECHIPGCGAVTQDQLEHERQEVTTHNFLLRQVGARGDGEHMVHGPLHSLQWAVADPTRPVRSPTFITSGNRTWEAMAVPPSRGVPWCVCLRLVAGPPALAKIRIKMSAAEQEAVVGCTAAILPGASGKKWDLQNITNTSNIRIHILIQH